MYKFFFKRFFDIAISFLLLFILFPFGLLISFLIKLTSVGSVFYFQKRLGRNGIVFKIIKFRTMIDNPRESSKEIFKGDPEVTKIGYYLRRFKIDELPQLINVFKGDMSLIGPRPALAIQFKEYNDLAKIRLLVRPGMTGLAQINGNIYLSWEDRWELDAKYVNNLSFTLDLSIALKTILVVLFGEENFKKS